jgi:hypothetical protein
MVNFRQEGLLTLWGVPGALERLSRRLGCGVGVGSCASFCGTDAVPWVSRRSCNEMCSDSARTRLRDTPRDSEVHSPDAVRRAADDLRRRDRHSRLHPRRQCLVDATLAAAGAPAPPEDVINVAMNRPTQSAGLSRRSTGSSAPTSSRSTSGRGREKCREPRGHLACVADPLP